MGVAKSNGDICEISAYHKKFVRKSPSKLTSQKLTSLKLERKSHVVKAKVLDPEEKDVRAEAKVEEADDKKIETAESPMEESINSDVGKTNINVENIIVPPEEISVIDWNFESGGEHFVPVYFISVQILWIAKKKTLMFASVAMIDCFIFLRLSSPVIVGSSSSLPLCLVFTYLRNFVHVLSFNILNACYCVIQDWIFQQQKIYLFGGIKVVTFKKNKSV